MKGKLKYTQSEVELIFKNEGCELLDVYTGVKNKMKYKCSCGNISNISLDNFKRGKRCGCDKKTNWDLNLVKDFIEKNSDCKLLSNEYKKSSDKMVFMCSCGNVFETTFAKFKDRNKRKCNGCNGVTNWNYDLIKKFVSDNSECELLNIIHRRNEYAKLKCSCGEEFEVNFSKFIDGKRKCNKCLGVINWENEDIIKYIKDNSECDIIKIDFNGIESKLKLRCKCGNIFTTKFKNFKNKNKTQCNSCGEKNRNEKQRHNFETISKFISENTNCTLISCDGYKNLKSNIKCKCNCGRIFTTRMINFVSFGKKMCDICGYKNTKGEQEISNILKEKSITFEREYTFEDLININKLRFDFAVFNDKKKNSLKMLIEYQGEGHYKTIDWSGCGEEHAEKQLEIIKFRDELKTKYCYENNIKLLKIPYWEFNNIEDILQEHLK